MGRPKDTTVYTEKRCTICGITKPMAELIHDKRAAGGRRQQCKKCEVERQLKVYHANPEPHRAKMRKLSNLHQRKWNLSRFWKMTPEDFDKMRDAHGGVCAICKCPPPGGKGNEHLHIDHCHSTNKIRGLLCNNCNNGIGRFKDDPTNLRAAADYLEKYLSNT